MTTDSIRLSTHSVGVHFATIGVCTVNGRSVETDVLPYGFESAAKQQALEAALEAGLLREIGETTPEGKRAVLRAGAVLLLGRYVVVAGNDPRPDSLIASDIERYLAR